MSVFNVVAFCMSSSYHKFICTIITTLVWNSSFSIFRTLEMLHFQIIIILQNRNFQREARYTCTSHELKFKGESERHGYVRTAFVNVYSLIITKLSKDFMVQIKHLK